MNVLQIPILRMTENSFKTYYASCLKTIICYINEENNVIYLISLETHDLTI